jgi:hypothetical protein
MIFDPAMLYDFEEVCTGMPVRKESVEAIAFIRKDQLPDPFPTFTVTEAADALAESKDHPVLKVWFSDAEAIAHGAQQVFEVNWVIEMMRGQRPEISADYRVYFLVSPLEHVWQWLPVQLRGEGKNFVKAIKLIVDSKRK